LWDVDGKSYKSPQEDNTFFCHKSHSRYGKLIANDGTTEICFKKYVDGQDGQEDKLVVRLKKNHIRDHPIGVNKNSLVANSKK